MQECQLNVGYMQLSAARTEINYQLTHGMMKQLPLHKWIAGHWSNATLVLLVAGHLYVAFLTPGSSPAETITSTIDQQ